MKKMRFYLLSLFLLLGLSSVFGQQKIMVIDSTLDGQIKFAEILNTVHSGNFIDSKNFLKEVLITGNYSDFYLYKQVKDKLGVHEKFQQTFRGIKVEFGEFIVHKDKSDNIYAINGDFKRIPDEFGINCKLQFDEALSILKKEARYQVLELPEEQSVEAHPIQKSKEYEVVIIKGNDEKLHLAYKTNLMTDIFNNIFGYIDCETGRIVFEQPLTYVSNTTGSAATLYSGNVNLITDSYTGGYRLQESSRNNTGTSIQTYNFNRAPAVYTYDFSTGIANATDFSDNDNNWTNGEFNNSYHDIAALDSHWGSENTFDYFYTVHGRNSYNGSGGLIKNYVHVRTRDNNNNAIDMDNAFWSSSYNAMFFGDGNFMNPVVSLDVIGHEFAHAVCNAAIGNGTGLIYSKEPGALNESLSDMWGACVEDWATDNKQTWIIGEEILTGGLRSMANPNLHSQPDTYQSLTFWYPITGCTPSLQNDYCGVHTNSGVGNFWFFLLVNGGSGTNDLNNNYSVPTIGITKAAQIVYLMETAYLISTSSYTDARTQSISASTYLFGANSCETFAVKNAWYAVGVGTIPTTATTSGPTLICSTGTFTVNNVPSGYTVSWGKSSNITLPTNINVNPIVATANGNGSGWVQATLNCTCGSIILPKYTVWVGTPVLNVTGPSEGCVNNTFNFDSNPTGLYSGATNYSWDLIPLNGSYLNPYNMNKSCAITFYQPYSASGYRVRARAQNTCGTGNYGETRIWIHTCYYFSLSPNPASETVTITRKVSGSTDSFAMEANPEDANTIFTIRIIDFYGALHYSATKSGGSFTIPIGNLKDGSYIVQITEGKNTTNLTFIVKH